MSDVRPMRPADDDAVVTLIERVYGFEPGAFSTAYACDWAPGRIDRDRTLVAVEDGRIVSVARIYPLDLVLGPSHVRAGGIGFVGTAPEARGKGHMSRLLDRAIAQMRDERFPVSVLWGDRHRYGTFGYEPAGRQVNLVVTRRGLEWTGIAPREPVVYAGQPEVRRRVLHEYDRRSYRRIRPEADYDLLFGQPSHTLLVADDEDAYALLYAEYGERVLFAECGGDARVALGLVRHRMASHGIDSVLFAFPDGMPIPKPIEAAASGGSIVPACMLRVLDPEETLRTFDPQVGYSGCPHAGVIAAMPVRQQARALFGTFTDAPFRIFIAPHDTV